MLNFFYGDLRKPSSTTHLRGNLTTFDQSDFFHVSSPALYSMDSTGYVYIPSGCQSKTTRCKLHIAIHGCGQGRTVISEAYVRHAGYNEVGELNNIIILYPQVIKTPTNLQGCWDWFGYTGPAFGKPRFLPTYLCMCLVTSINRAIRRRAMSATER
ncbi:hypothetical protein ScPMuIL_010524 [Solemya velum]